MAHYLVVLGEVTANAATTGGAIPVTPPGPMTIIAEDTSASTTYDSTATIQGSIDNIVWVTLGTMTAEADKIDVSTPYLYLRVNGASGGTAAKTLKVRALWIAA